MIMGWTFRIVMQLLYLTLVKMNRKSCKKAGLTDFKPNLPRSQSPFGNAIVGAIPLPIEVWKRDLGQREMEFRE
jgi:hypothetical protein